MNWILVVTAFSLGGAPEPARFSLDEIAQGLARSAKAFLESDSFCIELAVTRSEQLAPTKYGHPVGGFEFILAKRNRNFLVHVREPTESGKTSKPTMVDRKVAYRDHVFVDSLGWSATIDSEVNGHTWAWWYYTDNLFLNVYQYIDLPAALRDSPPMEWQQPFLPEQLYRHAGAYHVRAEQEQVEEVWCHVVERPGIDRFWVDAARGFVVLRRELNWGPELPLSTVVVNQQLQEPKPGLWLPWRQIREMYADPRTEERRFWGKISNRRTFEVRRLEFDTLDDDFFRIDIPDGAHVVDNIRHITYVKAPADAPPFEEALRYAKRQVGWQRFGRVLLLAVGLAGGIVVALVLFRRLRALRKAMH